MIIEKCSMPDISYEKDKALSSFIAHSLGGAYLHLTEEKRRLLPLMARLVDKSKQEYLYAREAALEEEKESKLPFWKIEIRNKGQYIYAATIINHLENCINAISRIYKSLDRLEVNVVPNNSISVIRNNIEHMDERISKEDRSGSVSLNISNDALQLELVNDYLSINDLAEEIVRLNKLTIKLLEELSSI